MKILSTKSSKQLAPESWSQDSWGTEFFMEKIRDN